MSNGRAPGAKHNVTVTRKRNIKNYIPFYENEYLNTIFCFLIFSKTNLSSVGFPTNFPATQDNPKLPETDVFISLVSSYLHRYTSEWGGFEYFLFPKFLNVRANLITELVVLQMNVKKFFENYIFF